jgi:hypothetical protein
MNWNEIRISIINDLNSRGLANPNIRINALERLEVIMKSHFKEILDDPSKLKKIDKNDFKERLAKFKTNGNLNGAESSVINEIYYRIER